MARSRLEWQAALRNAALRNVHVRIGERELKDGRRLRGLYALRRFDPGDYVASFHGRVYERSELPQIYKDDRALFDRIIEYAVTSSSADGHLCPEDLDVCGAHLINHSCGPNADWADRDGEVLLVKADKRIDVGQEITIHYRWAGLKSALDGKRQRCACQALMCCGFVELYVEKIAIDEKSEATYLPPEEVARRFLADMVNDTNANEDAVIGYGMHADSMFLGEGPKRGIDPAEFFEKCHEGASKAVFVALKIAARFGEKRISRRRFEAIVKRYQVRIEEMPRRTGT